jgi:hypothetical protein
MMVTPGGGGQGAAFDVILSSNLKLRHCRSVDLEHLMTCFPLVGLGEIILSVRGGGGEGGLVLSGARRVAGSG